MSKEKKITIRIPPDLHESLIRLAEQDTRSLNGEIIALLREAIVNRKQEDSSSS